LRLFSQAWNWSKSSSGSARVRPEDRGGRAFGVEPFSLPAAGTEEVPKKSSKENPPVAVGSLLGVFGTCSGNAEIEPRPPSSPNTESSEIASLAGRVGLP
jgi:hypothetical protein